MALPTNRREFRDFVMRALGEPVIEINVSEDQVQDKIDSALRYYWDYHYDGSEKVYYKALLTPEDIQNKYITMPENIFGVINVFEIGRSIGANDMFNVRYQIALNDLYTLTSVSMVPYHMAMTHLQLLEEMLVGRQPIRYNRHQNRCYIDMDWNIVTPGMYLIIEAYQVIDPDEFPRCWGDRWLARYTECLIKEVWGNNLKKFGNMKLPGGVTFNGQQIYTEAVQERKDMEKEMISLSLPSLDQIG